MIGGDLFRRFFLRYLIGLGVAFLLFLPLVHIFQQRIVAREWSEDLQDQATWITRHYRSGELGVLAHARRTLNSTVRLTFFDADGKAITDSHPGRDLPDLEALREGRATPGAIAAIQALDQGWLVMSRPGIPGFPAGMSWTLVVAAVFVVGLVLLLLYPLVRSMTSTLGELGRMAEEVAAGHFGKTLDIERPDELGVLVCAFNDMSQKLAEAERLNTRLLNDVSHELRSPLGRIQVMSETIALRPAETDACIQGIGQEIGLLDRLVGDLLQTARLESDAQSSQWETVSILDWAGETLPRLKSKVQASAIRWSTQLPEEDSSVRMDSQRLAQAVGNLVDNAIHALEGRDDPRIDISLAIGADTWTLTVEDNGPGIPADDQPHVFRRFYRVGDDRGRDGGGVGLGLSLVRAIAEAHGGEASIESRAGENTRVTLSLPLG